MVPGNGIVQLIIILFKIFNKQKGKTQHIKHLGNQIKAVTGQLSTSLYLKKEVTKKESTVVSWY
jgi:hypothetical protein